MLVPIRASRVFASSSERVDLMLLSLDSASLCASAFALIVSRIRSLSNRIDVSSAAFRAPFVGTGGRTRRSFGMT